MSSVSPQQRPTNLLGAEDRDPFFVVVTQSVGECIVGSGPQGEGSGKLEQQNCGFDYHNEEFSLDFGELTLEGGRAGL